MSSFLRKLVLALIMATLPLQGALAAIMPLCVQAGQVLRPSLGVQPPVQAPVHATATPCSQHDASNGSLANRTGENQESFNLPCDDAICYISAGALPSATAPLNLFGGFSFTAPFKSRFTSSILPQPHRPPLA
jgi:hypothetical protein